LLAFEVAAGSEVLRKGGSEDSSRGAGVKVKVVPGGRKVISSILSSRSEVPVRGEEGKGRPTVAARSCLVQVTISTISNACSEFELGIRTGEVTRRRLANFRPLCSPLSVHPL